MKDNKNTSNSIDTMLLDLLKGCVSLCQDCAMVNRHEGRPRYAPTILRESMNLCSGASNLLIAI